MESIEITSESLKKKGYRQVIEGGHVMTYGKGSDIPWITKFDKKDLPWTVKQLEKKLSDKGVPQLDISEMESCMSANFKLLMNNGSDASSASSERPLEKLEDMTFEQWQAELMARHQMIQNRIRASAMPLCNLWTSLEFALSIKSILHIADVTEPFAGILMAPASSLKTVTIDLFRKYWRAYFTHNFTPKSWVSHNTSLSDEILTEKVDLLPRTKDRYLLTPELAPTFAAKEEELKQNLALLSAVLDGKGLFTNSGGFGRRGYEGEYNFMWLGAVVDIPRHVYPLMGNVGPKLYFLRLPYTDRTEEQLIEQTRQGRYQSDLTNIEIALYDYLKWFEACPVMYEKNGLPKIEWDRSKDEYKAVKYIARLAKLIAHLRGVVDTWDTSGSQGSDYAYNYRKIEEPDRANRQLGNLARGHALSQGRNYLTMDDIPLPVKVVLSTAPLERVAVFELLIKKGGRLETNDIIEGLRVSNHTAHRVMTELYALELVNRQKEGDYYNSKMVIELESAYNWCLQRAFLQIRQGFSPTRISSNIALFGKRGSKRGDNVEEGSRKHVEKCTPHTGIIFSFFWETYDRLEKQNPEEGKVSESMLKQELVSSGRLDAGPALQMIKDMIDNEKLVRLGFDVLVKNSPSGMHKNRG